MFNKARPVLDYNMRTYKFEPDTGRVYLYDLTGVKINGYFIRQEVAADLLLRGMPTVALNAVRGDMFINKTGAGIVLSKDWREGQGADAVLVELCGENTRLAQL